MDAIVETKYIGSDPDILGGTPCIRGTRLNVYAMRDRLRGDETPESIAAEYPGITAEMVRAAAEYADRYPLVVHPEGKPWKTASKRRDVA